MLITFCQELFGFTFCQELFGFVLSRVVWICFVKSCLDLCRVAMTRIQTHASHKMKESMRLYAARGPLQTPPAFALQKGPLQPPSFLARFGCSSGSTPRINIYKKRRRLRRKQLGRRVRRRCGSRRPVRRRLERWGVAVAPAVGAWTPRAHGAREGRVRAWFLGGRAALPGR
jgi:hypothetical protein